MNYDQQVMAFAATRLPVIVGAALVLAAGARRWRTDRGAAGLLLVGGVLLAAYAAAWFPVKGPVRAWGVWTDPLWERGWSASGAARPRGFWGGMLVDPRTLLVGAAACGLAAVFLRRDPAGRGAA